MTMTARTRAAVDAGLSAAERRRADPAVDTGCWRRESQSRQTYDNGGMYYARARMSTRHGSFQSYFARIGPIDGGIRPVDQRRELVLPHAR
jgi:hypothetical protein